MTSASTLDLYGRLTAPDTLVIERLLPGPVERIWSYLTDSDKRAKWLAAGEMPQTVGAEFTLTWRNDTLTTPPGARPDGFGAEHSATCRLLAVTPPHRLVYDWPGVGEVEIALAPEGTEVRLTLTHRRTPDRGMRVMVGAGWHAHLDILSARISGREPAPFWDRWRTLRADYDARLPG